MVCDGLHGGYSQDGRAKSSRVWGGSHVWYGVVWRGPDRPSLVLPGPVWGGPAWRGLV